jgi:hypothetical protein
MERSDDPQDSSYGMPDADEAPPEGENPSGPIGEIQPDEDTSGGPLQSGAGPGSGEAAAAEADAERDEE